MFLEGDDKNCVYVFGCIIDIYMNRLFLFVFGDFLVCSVFYDIDVLFLIELIKLDL